MTNANLRECSNRPSDQILAVAKGQAQPRSCSVVAAGKTWWWAVIPITIESEIPIQFAPKLDIVGSVQIEVISTRVRNGRKEGSIQCEGSSVESEKLQA